MAQTLKIRPTPDFIDSSSTILSACFRGKLLQANVLSWTQGIVLGV